MWITSPWRTGNVITICCLLVSIAECGRSSLALSFAIGPENNLFIQAANIYSSFSIYHPMNGVATVKHEEANEQRSEEGEIRAVLRC